MPSNLEHGSINQLQQLQALIHSVPVGLFRTDAEGNCTYVNDQWCEIAGMRQAEALGQGWVRAIHPEDRELVFRSWDEAVKAKVPFKLEYRFLTPQGDETWVYGLAHPEFDAQSKIVGHSGSITDITDRKSAEQTIRQMNITLQSAMEGIAHLDTHGRYVEVNPAYGQICGYEPEDLIGQPWQQTVWPEDVAMLEAAYRVMLDTGKVSLEARGKTQQGELFYQQITMVVDRTAAGERQGYYCFVSDISDRKYAEAQLIESEQRFQAMADSSPALIWVANDKNQRTYFNQEWLNFTGRTLTQEVNQGWMEGVHPDDFIDCQEQFSQGFSQQQVVQAEYRLRNHNGQYRWLLDSARPRYVGENEFVGYIGSCIDITQIRDVKLSLENANLKLQANIADNIDALVEAHAQLQESEARFRSLADSVPALIWLCDIDQNCTYVNQTWQTFTGHSLEEELGKGWLDNVHPEDIHRYVATLQQAIHLKEPMQIELRRRNSMGRYRWVLSTGMPRYVSAEFLGLAGFCLDITESKQSREALEHAVTELQRSNRELEEFAYIASHDLREPLRKVRAFSEFMLMDYAPQLDDKGRRHLNYIVDGAKRMDTLVQSVLQYSRLGRQVNPLEPVNLNQVVQNIARDYSLLLEQEQGWIVFEALPTVKARKVEVIQLLQNLMDNALKYHGDRPPCVTIAAQRQGSHWRISIQDNGMGIAPEFRDRVFQLFTRQHHHDQYPGTGIGLAICRKIVENYGGQIDFESEVGKGTTFFFTLPAID